MKNRLQIPKESITDTKKIGEPKFAEKEVPGSVTGSQTAADAGMH